MYLGGAQMSERSLNAGFLSAERLADFGLLDADKRRILIHSTAVIVNFDAIRFGNNIRVDPFVVLSCNDLVLGNNIHIASGCGLFGVSRIALGDFANLSSKVLVYSSSDDYSGATMTNPTIPSELKCVEHAPVNIGRHCILGARSTILPGSDLGEGAAVGSCSLVKGILPAWTISVGVPAKPIKQRARGCLDKEADFHEMKMRDLQTDQDGC
jgi:galactoside O-acetyltransferase